MTRPSPSTVGGTFSSVPGAQGRVWLALKVALGVLCCAFPNPSPSQGTRLGWLSRALQGVQCWGRTGRQRLPEPWKRPLASPSNRGTAAPLPPLPAPAPLCQLHLGETVQQQSTDLRNSPWFVCLVPCVRGGWVGAPSEQPCFGVSCSLRHQVRSLRARPQE